MGNINRIKKILLLFGDIFVMYLSLYFALLSRYFSIPDSTTLSNHLWPFSIIFIFWITIFYISNLYNLHLAANKPDFYSRSFNAILLSGLLAVLFFYLNPTIGISPKTTLFVYLIIFILLFFIWRSTYNSIIKKYLPKNRVAFVGYSQQIKEIISEFEAKPHLGFKTSFIFTPLTEVGSHQHKIINELSELQEKIAEYKINTVVVGENPNEKSELRTVLFKCLPYKINFVNLPDFYESITGKIPIDAINQMWFLENLSEGRKKIFSFIKRAFDIVFSLFIFFFTLPLWPIIGIAIKTGSKGPVFFVQTRCGKNEKFFKLIKFRSMLVEGNNQKPTVKNDSRVSKLGLLLRKTRIDEIPQVINVLFGDMSFVGPRPEQPKLIATLEKQVPFYRERMLVKPGLSGWDQISGEYHSPSYEDTMKKLQYDLYYIKNRSVYLDISILLKTIATVLSKQGL